MASEIRVNQIQSRTGVSTISFTDTGPIFAGVSTVQGSLTVDQNLTATGNITVGPGATISGSTNTIIASTNSSERVRVTGIGSVGIGTDNPVTKLDVQDGDITIRNGTEHNAIRTTSDGKLQFLRNGAANNQVTVTIDDANGNVGIGTDNPGTLLHVRHDSGEVARFQVNTQTSSGRITCIGGTASYSGINFGDSDNVDAGRIRHYNDDNSTAVDSFLFYTNDTERIALNKYGLLTNYPGSNSEVSGGTILGRYKYTQENQSQNYEHVILGPDGRKLQDLVDTNCFCVITICVTGTGTNNMFCQYHYHANQSVGNSALTHIAGNDQSSSNRPYMVLVNTHDPAWKMNHNTSYTLDIEVAIYGGNDQYTYTTQFGEFGANP